eukprot:1147965-Pelagomonas_calceolata.AAC.4
MQAAWCNIKSSSSAVKVGPRVLLALITDMHIPGRAQIMGREPLAAWAHPTQSVKLGMQAQQSCQLGLGGQVWVACSAVVNISRHIIVFGTKAKVGPPGNPTRPPHNKRTSPTDVGFFSMVWFVQLRSPGPGGGWCNELSNSCSLGVLYAASKEVELGCQGEWVIHDERGCLHGTQSAMEQRTRHDPLCRVYYCRDNRVSSIQQQADFALEQLTTLSPTSPSQKCK